MYKTAGKIVNNNPFIREGFKNSENWKDTQETISRHQELNEKLFGIPATPKKDTRPKRTHDMSKFVFADVPSMKSNKR